MKIRREIPDDYESVRNIHLASFANADEADLVDHLRADGDAVVSLVAMGDEYPLGHVMFSVMNAPFKSLGLGPVAVLAAHRRQGVADRLIRKGIEQAQHSGWEGLFVLGSPPYYQRFGFSAAQAEKFISPYAGPYLMALALQAGGLPVSTGNIDYAPAFARLG